jgi:hypothetical protein
MGIRDGRLIDNFMLIIERDVMRKPGRTIMIIKMHTVLGIGDG